MGCCTDFCSSGSRVLFFAAICLLVFIGGVTALLAFHLHCPDEHQCSVRRDSPATITVTSLENSKISCTTRDSEHEAGETTCWFFPSPEDKRCDPFNDECDMETIEIVFIVTGCICGVLFIVASIPFLKKQIRNCYRVIRYNMRGNNDAGNGEETEHVISSSSSHDDDEIDPI